jgi:hypothetical protein
MPTSLCSTPTYHRVPKVGVTGVRGRNYGRICLASFGDARVQGVRRASGRPMSRQFAWGDSSMATQRDDRQRPLPSAQCSLCGIALPTGLMVPDGGQACADVRWYCKDAKACTERWTASLPRHAHIAPTPASLAPALAPMPGPMPGGSPVPAEVLGAPEEAWSIDPS